MNGETENYCRLLAMQCSRMQELVMKVAPEEHAEGEVTPVSISKHKFLTPESCGQMEIKP